MKRFSSVLTALAALCGAHSASAACTTSIDSVPYVISAPGEYCLGRSVKLNVPGNAVEIRSSNVVLDLQNYSIVSGVLDARQYTQGITSQGFNSITVRNGRIRGFTIGVNLQSDIPSAGNYLVERLIVRSSNHTGISLRGGGSTIQDNVISNSGARFAPNDFVTALMAGGGGGNLTVQNNRIDNTQGSGIAPGGGDAIGAQGIVVYDAPASAIVDNTVTDTTAGANKALGIVYSCFANNGVVCTLSSASSNEILNSAAAPGSVGFTVVGATTYNLMTMKYTNVDNFREGIKFINANGVYIRCVVAGATTPYIGGRAFGTSDIEP